MNISTTRFSPAEFMTDLLRIGYVPLIDAAPLIVAKEMGIFEAHGVRVALSREPGWASIRQKILYGELECAHAIAGLAIAMSYGLGSLRQHCVTGFLLNSHGDAITLSTRLRDAGVVDLNTLAAHARTVKRERPLTLAMVHPFSSHHFLLRTWLRSAGMIPGRDLQLVVIPPPHVVRNLELDHIDGFCVGEPWNSLAEQNGTGFIVARSAEIAPLHPEKALIVRRTFAEEHEDHHLALIRALNEACGWCDQLENRPALVDLLSRPQYLGLDRELLQRSLGMSEGDRAVGLDMHVFHRMGVNKPSSSSALWLLSEMREAGLLDGVDLRQMPSVDEIFRTDIHDQALLSSEASSS